jgi:exopolyphosphatase/guanosine-5'-triphosphate,3'-diphosphate pyrophosphatase
MSDVYPHKTPQPGKSVPDVIERPYAAIEIGSTGIRLIVAEIDAKGELKILDRASKQSRLGRDVFTMGSISRDGLRETIAILNSFGELLQGYGLQPSDIQVIGTSALREAANRDTFIDRIGLQTGFHVRIVEDIEETHLMYLAVKKALEDERSFLTRSNAMILEVGGGTTEVMLLKKGQMVSSHSLSIGTLRIDEQIRESARQPRQFIEMYLESNIKTACDMIAEDLPLDSVRTFVLIGSDARFAAYCLSGKMFSHYAVLDRTQFIEFADSMASMSTEECMAQYHLSWNEAESYAVGLTIERMFLEKTGTESIIVPNASIREGILLAQVQGMDPTIEEELRRQVIASARALAKRFRYDEAHAAHVKTLSLELFDALKKEHGLGKHERMLLEVAAILHDIGTFLRTSGHHRHSEYLIANSEIFGLNREDINIVSNVARYHRKTPPLSTHVNYIGLPRESRIVVLKLAAILRVSDALDRSHSGRVRDISFERTEDRFIIRPSQSLDFSLEKLSLAEKGDMFEDVFGLLPILM